jgi:NADH:ubiquinone oxidoreductase subunit
MGILGKIFTWWDGATIGTMLYSSRKGELVGEDNLGNRYYQSRSDKSGESPRRWVMYNGSNDAARVSPDWHGWLHGTFDGHPDSYLPTARAWELDSPGNPTGSAAAYRPAGAIEKGGARAKVTGDYQAWSPDAA